ncbi:MAG: hypothetical protein ACLTLQ_18040 [[Clostridium] scindens]
MRTDSGLPRCKRRESLRIGPRQLADFEAGRYNVPCNSMLLTEGSGLVRSVDCISQSCSPTKAREACTARWWAGATLPPSRQGVICISIETSSGTQSGDRSMPSGTVRSADS